jgi:hypothetical protein
MRQPIFDQVSRSDTAPRRHEESAFSFYSRVSGEFWSPVRELVQTWADWLPEEGYGDTRARLRSGDDSQFNSAYLELYLHELLRRAGYDVTVHPPTLSGRRPDFHAARAESARISRLYRVLEETNDSNWWLWLERIDSADTSPPAAKLRSEVRAWLRQLDPADHRDLSRRPRFVWEAAGWRVVISAVPTTDTHRQGSSMRSIGVYPATGGGVDNSSPIIQALGRKDRAYGELADPLVIAVGLFQFDRDRVGIRNALWGGDTVQGSTDARDPDVSPRQPGGYFGGPGNWRHTNVSGVLIVNQLQPTHFLAAETSLSLHPAPAKPLPTSIGLPVDLISLTPEGLTTTPPSISPRPFFNMPDIWPPGEAFPRPGVPASTSTSRGDTR